MLETIVVLLRLVTEATSAVLRPAAELVGVMVRALFETGPAVPSGEAGLLVLAVALLAGLALLAVALGARLSPAAASAAAPHPRRAIADSTRLTASHPDAPGHSRPRAPGPAALAA